MGLFDVFKKKSKIIQPSESERLENFPEMLTVKLLFEKKPNLSAKDILKELQQYFDQVENNEDIGNIKCLIFAFPNIRINLVAANIPAQCTVFIPNDDKLGIDIPEVALQQNWHWNEANENVKKCNYELLITDLMTRTLDYKERLNLYMNFLVAVTKATKPDVIYSVCGQKLIKPDQLLLNWDEESRRQLFYAICNVRLYNITGSGHRDILMDTVGLGALGLPDFQIRSSTFEANEIASLLWNYAYYIYEMGDIIETGNTLEGVQAGGKWKCERKVSPLQPERVIIDVSPS